MKEIPSRLGYMVRRTWLVLFVFLTLCGNISVYAMKDVNRESGAFAPTKAMLDTTVFEGVPDSSRVVFRKLLFDKLENSTRIELVSKGFHWTEPTNAGSRKNPPVLLKSYLCQSQDQRYLTLAISVVDIYSDNLLRVISVTDSIPFENFVGKYLNGIDKPITDDRYVLSSRTEDNEPRCMSDAEWLAFVKKKNTATAFKVTAAVVGICTLIIAVFAIMFAAQSS